LGVPPRGMRGSSAVLLSIFCGAFHLLAYSTTALAQSQVYERILRDYQKKDYSSALTLAADAIKTDGNNASLRYIYGLTLTELQHFTEAAENLGKAIELKPSDSTFHQGLAYLYCKQKNYDGAIPILKRSIELDSQNLKARFLLGLAYLSKERSSLIGNFTELALEQLEFVAAKQATFPQVHLYIGKIHLTNGDVAKALRELTTELEIDPRNLQAHMEAAEVLVKLDQPKEALAHLQQVLAASPSTKGLHYAFAKAYRQNGQLAEAISSARRALEMDPQAAEIHYLLAQIYQEANEPGLAKDHIEAFHKLKTSTTSNRADIMSFRNDQ